MVFVANLSSLPIGSAAEFEAIYKLVPSRITILLLLNLTYSQATKNRSIGATNLNRASSRSHAILTIEITMDDPSEQKSRLLSFPKTNAEFPS